jgi:TonB family protein
MALRIPPRLKSSSSAGLIMRISLLVSVLFHIVLLLSFRDAFPLYMNPEDLRTYEVELIRPPVEDMDRTEKADADIDKAKEDPKPAQEETQETISLDTEDKRYVTYARLIKERIMAHWSYPRKARDNLLEGRLLVIFSLDKQGALTRLDVGESSGYDILDLEAAGAIKNASPFPPFPEQITVSRLNVRATFDYHLTTKRKVKNTGARSQKTEEKTE